MDSNSNSSILASSILADSPFSEKSVLPDHASHSDSDSNNFSKAQTTIPAAHVQSTNNNSHGYELRSRSHNYPNNQRASPQLQYSNGAFLLSDLLFTFS